MIAFWVFLVTVAVQGDQCTDPSNQAVTLSNLANKELDAINDAEYDYLYTVCAVSGSAGDCTQANNAVDYCGGNFAVCQCKKANRAGYPLGDTTKATWAKNSDGSYQLSFGGIAAPNDNGPDPALRAASIKIVCDEVAPVTTFVYTPGSKYEFVLTSSHTCFDVTSTTSGSTTGHGDGSTSTSGSTSGHGDGTGHGDGNADLSGLEVTLIAICVCLVAFFLGIVFTLCVTAILLSVAFRTGLAYFSVGNNGGYSSQVGMPIQ